jgi:glutamyl-Q tRNA(Asp) synthetase
MSDYIGRFAPSPTGLLHLGSLIGALASYLDAKAAGGCWLLRVEDLDPPREMTGAGEQILESLIAHGLQWDDDVLWQSRRHSAYTDAIDSLMGQDKGYFCTCTRADIQANHGVYSGRCRGQIRKPDTAFATRAQLPDIDIALTDGIQGHFHQNLQHDTGDVIVRRKDGLFAYQLAVVVDDAYQGITHVVRGSDLLESTPRQIALQQLLKFPTPQYAHFPVVTDRQGHKLSKQTFAKALPARDTIKNLITALEFLQQDLPPSHLRHNTRAVLDWATAHWCLEKIPRCLAVEGKTL